MAEMMIAMGIFMLVMTAIVSSNLFGFRMLQATQPKLEADEQARNLAGELIDDIRSAQAVRVGTGNGSAFTPIAAGSSQVGNALEIRADTNAAWSLRYFWDSASQSLMRITNGGDPVEIVAAVTNSDVFRAQDCWMTNATDCLTSDQENPVILVCLSFSSIGASAAPVGPDFLFTGYQLQLRATPRKR
jgi:hypothetical protein